jgi:hypothetical protein
MVWFYGQNGHKSAILFFFKEKNALPTKISPYDLKPHPIYRVGVVVLIWKLDLLLHVQLSWQSVLLVEKTTDLSQVTDKLYRVHLVMNGVRTRNVSGDGHIKMATMQPY